MTKECRMTNSECQTDNSALILTLRLNWPIGTGGRCVGSFMGAEHSEVLASALEQHSPAIISAGEGKERRDVLVQFTTARSDASAVGFWARVHHGDAKLIDRLIKSAEDVGVSFNTSSAKINFRTALLKKRRRHLIHKLLLIRWPEKISVVEQRQKPRVWVPDRYRLGAKIQTLSPAGEVLSAAPVRVWDSGRGGHSWLR